MAVIVENNYIITVYNVHVIVSRIQKIYVPCKGTKNKYFSERRHG